MPTSRTNIFNAAKELATQLDNVAPVRVGDHDCTYALPREERTNNADTRDAQYSAKRSAAMDAFHARELLVAAAQVIDPSVQLNSSVLDCSLTFRSVLPKFPKQQIWHALNAIRTDLSRTAEHTENGVHFAVDEDAGYSLDFVLRAALSMPEHFDMQFLLPGKYRDGAGNKVSGLVSYEQLMDLRDTADREMNHEALTELHQARCVGADISREQAQLLDARLGMNLSQAVTR